MRLTKKDLVLHKLIGEHKWVRASEPGRRDRKMCMICGEEVLLGGDEMDSMTEFLLKAMGYVCR